jgi:hypothetical protein
MKAHRLFTAAALSLAAVTAHAQTELQDYVTRCQNELEFTANEVQPMNCMDGVQFDTNGGRGPINDFVVHKRVNANVDMVAACRWGNGTSTLNDNTRFASLELIIHNRVKGGTCFFAARDLNTDVINKPVSTAIVSPTNFSTRVYPNANDYWLTPTEMNAKLLLSDINAFVDPDIYEQLQCVRCHTQGPYIASIKIAKHLANIGLLNDGHDTHHDSSQPRRYYAVGSNADSDPLSGSHPLKNWNNLISTHSQPEEGTCSGGCHALARKKSSTFTPIGSLRPIEDQSGTLLPSIAYDRMLLERDGHMPPSKEDSAWRWINIDQPGTDSAEVETFTAAKKVPIPVTGYCGVPGMLEAKAYGTDAAFSTYGFSMLPNKLRAFNLRDGLLCLNADQPAGTRCADHQVSYKCPAGPVNKWTPWYNKDTSTTDDGDHEEISRTLTEATAYCGGKAPIAIRMQTLSGGAVTSQSNGPNDRLAQFSPTGLVCRNADQGSGQSCSSYIVRYSACRSTTSATLSKLRNAWTSLPTFGDRYLTTTNNVDGAETRAQGNNYQYPSQDWVIEPVSGNTVRLYDIWSGKYLTASSNSDQAVVQVKNSDATLTRQQWEKLTVSGSTTEVRFRNVGTGRYLTVGNYSGDPYFAPILSQSLSNQNWASQRWVVE